VINVYILFSNCPPPAATHELEAFFAIVQQLCQLRADPVYRIYQQYRSGVARRRPSYSSNHLTTIAYWETLDISLYDVWFDLTVL